MKKPTPFAIAPTLSDEETTRTRNALRMLLATAGLMTVIMFLTASMVPSTVLGVEAALAIGALIGAFLSWRGRPVLGVEIFLGILVLTSWSLPFTLAGSGIIVVVVLVLFAHGVTLMTLSPQLVKYNVSGGVVAAVIAILLDTFGPAGREAITDFSPAAITMAVLIGGYLIVLYSQFRYLSLRTKLVVMLVGVTLLSISSITYISNVITRTQLTDDAGANLKNIARTQAQALGTTLEQQANQLEAFALSLEGHVAAISEKYSGSPEAVRATLTQRDQQWQAARSDDDPLVRARLQNDAAEQLDEYRKKYGDNLDLFVTDAYGALVASTTRTPRYLYADERWWKEAYLNGNGAVYISQPEIELRAPVLTSLIAVPIYNHKTKEVMGILRTNYRVEALVNLANRASFGESGRVEVYLAGTQQLSKIATLESPTPAEQQLIAEVQKAATGYRVATYQGATQLVSFAFINTPTGDLFVSNLKWLVLVHQNSQESLRAVDNQFRTITLLSLLAICVTSVIAVGFAQVLASPIVRLTQTAEQIAAGNLSARAQIESRDEVGRLATTFNRMTDELQQTLQGLEQRVQDRTAQLAQQAAYLTALNEISVSLLGRTDLEALLRDILVRAGELVGAPNGFLYLSEPDGSEMRMRVGTGVQHELVGNRIQPGAGLAGQVWASQQALVVNDYQNWAGRLGYSALRAVLGVPLIARDQIIGILGLAHTTEGRTFTENEVEILRRFAPLASLALENARLYEQTQQTLTQVQRQAEQRQIVSAITNKLHRATDVQSVMQIAAQELHKITGSQRLVVSFEPSSRSSQNSQSSRENYEIGKES